MNTGTKFLIFTCAALMSLACSREEELPVSSEGIEITVTAVREEYAPDTKTVLMPDGSVEWLPTDEISVFYGEGKDQNGGSRFTAQNTEQAAVAEFKGRLEGVFAGGEAFTDGKYLYGVYPYSLKNSFENGVVTVTLPANQTAVEGTFASNLFLTMARSQDVNLAFYNICGGVKFTVSREDIVSVSLKGNSGEILAGTANVAFDESGKPAVLSGEVGSEDEITVYAPAGGTFEVGKEYYMVAYPAKFTSGYTMTFRTSDMKEGTFAGSNEAEILRSNFSVLDKADEKVSTWTDITSAGGGINSGVYLGIMGFNQRLYPYPVTELTDENKVGFDSFIDDLNKLNGTLLYHAVDNAINTLQSITLPTNLSQAAIVTFTDGLDQGSMMMTDKYNSEAEYLDAINRRLRTETVAGTQKITAFSIGLRGQDVTDETRFWNNLVKLQSDTVNNANAYEVTSMTEVNATFKEIAEQLSRSNYVQTITIKFTGNATGSKYRFTFDKPSKLEYSEVYIEGTFNRETNSLENVEYKGLTSSSGTEVMPISVEDPFVTVMFQDVQTDNNKLIDNEFVEKWEWPFGTNGWQPSSEIDAGGDSQIVTERNSAVIMLVLDCSSSLGEDFDVAKSNAKEFVNTLHEAISEDDSLGQNPGDDMLYPTTPKDLSLAVWMGGTRYYLNQEEYNKVDLSDAVVEGLTVVGGGESFILSLRNIQTNYIRSDSIAMKLYKEILPSADQGRIISAKFSDINSAIKNFGGSALNSDRPYYTSSTSSTSDGFENCIYGSGGSLTTTGNWPYVRGVRPTSDSAAIYWRDPNDLKLSVIINGERKFLDEQEYEEMKAEIDTVEGVAVIAGGEKFVVHLNNAQSGSISTIETAFDLYGDIMPTAEQGMIISAKWTDINSAISSYGGNPMSDNSEYYTLSTAASSSYNFTNCIWGLGGYLSGTNYAPYIRGVTNIQ